MNKIVGLKRALTILAVQARSGKAQQVVVDYRGEAV
jgi:hypothetical protein